MRLIAAFFILSLFIGKAGFGDSCPKDSVLLQSPNGLYRFTVEIADTDKKRATGLMHREKLGKWAGMLFIFEQARPVSFWMKNTAIPLDILFFNTDGILMQIEKNTTPFSQAPIAAKTPILFVLEINAGLSDQLGIIPGTFLRHPAITSKTAALPCINLNI